MINKIFNKSISIFLTMVIILGLFPPAVFAQDELRGFNRSVFDSHFSRADREIDPGRWLIEAKLGLSQAINAWELIADSLYDNPHELNEARNQLNIWSNEEFERRFSLWLSNRFFGEAAEKAMMDYLNYSDEMQNENLTYHLYSEIIAYIPEESRALMNNIIYETASRKSNAIKMEFENIAARDERIKSNRHIRNFQNYNNQKEIEDARLFTERLLAETEAVCSSGIEEIKTKIEQAEAGTGDLALMGEEWLRLYKEQFERGLKAWEEAEERFFIRRLEWEQESLSLFSEGHDVWVSAFDRIYEEQIKWELQAKELLDAGNKLFSGLSNDLAKSISEAREEFNRNANLRIIEGAARVDALKEIYLLSISAAVYAKENEHLVESEMYSTFMSNASEARDKILSNYIDFLGSDELESLFSLNASSEDFYLDEYHIALIKANTLVTYWERKTSIAEAVTNFSNDIKTGRAAIDSLNQEWNNAKSSYNSSLIIYENEMKKLNALGEELQKKHMFIYAYNYNLEKSENLLDDNARNAYFEALNDFVNLGSLYDKQYSIVKSAYENVEQNRFQYEKYDAIKRWAATSYMDIDSFNLENCRENLARAQIVLNVLTDLHNDKSELSFNDPEYETLFKTYQQNYDRKIKILEIINNINSYAEQEFNNNYQLYVSYQTALNQLGFIDQNYKNYKSPDDKSKWTIKDIITIDDSGRIVFLRDERLFDSLDESNINELINYFDSKYIPEGEYQQTTMFEEALRGLSERMADYFNEDEKIFQWSLARDYLISSLINSNEELKFLINHYVGAGELENDQSMLSTQIIMSNPFSKENLYSYIQNIPYLEKNKLLGANVWENLSDEEKADLEFFTILTLSGNDSFTGFSQYYAGLLYNYVYEQANEYYEYASRFTDNWYFTLPFALLHIEMRDFNWNLKERLSVICEETGNAIKIWEEYIFQTFSSIADISSQYAASTKKLNILSAAAPNENDGNSTLQSIGWEEIISELTNIKNINEYDIQQLSICWNSMIGNTDRKFYSIKDAFDTLLYLANTHEENALNSLNSYWAEINEKQKINEFIYQLVEYEYLAGNMTIESLKAAAQTAYGEKTAFQKNHLNRMYSFTFKNLSAYLDMDIDLTRQFSIVGDELTYFTELIMGNRYQAELAAREIEWNQMQIDIEEKYNEWIKTAVLILERGRNDWAAGMQKMETSYNEWIKNFQNEYKRVSYEWDEAYLAGLEDKEKWLEQAANAANQASSEAFLSLVGAEGERLSRFIDIREPLGIRGIESEAQTIMAELLQSSGIVSFTSAFESLNSIASTASAKVKIGMGGISLWNSSPDKTAAAEIARRKNETIATAENRKQSIRIRSYAENSVKQLTANVDIANQNFRKSMDNTFIHQHLWRRNGNDYIKDVVKGSTLFSPVITETAIVEGYEDYILEPIILNTNMDDDHIFSLDSVAIGLLLDNVMSEIITIAGEIFGNSENPEGYFSIHIGTPPDRENDTDDTGTGELGRLFSELYDWYIIDSTGLAEMNMAPWDKRMWDDSDSWFVSPSLRTVGTIAGSIAVAAFSGGASLAAGIAFSIGISTATEVVFGSLDLVFGYKQFDEVAFNIGRTLLTSTLTSAMGGLFNGIRDGTNVLFTGLTERAVGLFESPLMKVLTEATMAGVQTGTSIIACSAINGITYSSNEGFGYNTDIFTAGLNNAWQNALVSMTGTFVSSGLTALNSGLDLSKLIGFNKLNKSDLERLNNLAGSLAGQGVNYMLGNDFTLNVLNLNLLTGGKVQGGILELHLGRDGFQMNIGTGGANVSIDNLIASFRGIDVWRVNNRISNYGEENDFDALVALRAQYGYGNTVQKNQLWDILNGNVLIDTSAEGDYTAKTEINGDGNRVIRLAGYEREMSIEDQFLFATVLGHEAYRDGYGVGDVDASGNVITRDSNFDELRTASIARIAMADRIHNENNWFYNLFEGLAYERLLVEVGMESNDYSLLNDYLELNYNNDADYHWLFANANGDYQNYYRSIPLFNSEILPQRIAAVNGQRLMDAFEKYSQTFTPQQWANEQALYEEFITNSDLQRQYGYRNVSTTSLAGYGCMFMSTKYGIEAILNEQVNTFRLHSFIRERGLIQEGTDNLLSRWLMAEIMTEYTNGQYTVRYVNSFGETPSIDTLIRVETSQEQYLAHLRVQNPNANNALIHSVMVSGINYVLSENDRITGVNRVYVANPLMPTNHFNTRLSYTPEEIIRWDFFRVTQNR